MSELELEQQRRRSLDAALHLFVKHGAPGVSMRSIAGAVDLTAMALYRYFPGGKNEVLATLRGRGFDGLAEQFEQASAADPLDRFLALVRTLVDFARENAALYRLMFDLTQPEEQEAFLAARRARAWSIPQGMLHALIDAGVLAADRELFPHLVFAAVHGVLCFELSAQRNPVRRASRLLGPKHETVFRGAGAGPAEHRRQKKAH